jgi:hypothetical protein
MNASKSRDYCADSKSKSAIVNLDLQQEPQQAIYSKRREIWDWRITREINPAFQRTTPADARTLVSGL